jgi:hypothetical protein
MRNPVATPASVIFGILVLGLVFFIILSMISVTKESYVLESNKAAFVWGNAFLQFTDAFIALQCAGALIAYSLFLLIPPFLERKAFFRSFYSILVSLIVLTVFYIVCFEGLAPMIKKNLRETRTMGLFTESLYNAALQKEKEGDIVSALEYIRLSLFSDGVNAEKIGKRSALLARLKDDDLQKYLSLSSGEEIQPLIDVTDLLKRAQAALDVKDYTKANLYASQVLSVDDTNWEARRIATIASEQSYQESGALEGESRQYLFDKKREGIAALEKKEFVKAYFIFADLRRKYPLESNVKDYLDETKKQLPFVSFNIREVGFALSFEPLLKKNIVFFNLINEDERELMTIEAAVFVGGEIYIKNVETVGFIRGNQVLYHYTAPLGKILFKEPVGKPPGYYVNVNGIDKSDPTQRRVPQVLFGKPPIDPEYGIKLNINPRQLVYFTYTKNDFTDVGIAELFTIFQVLSNHAKMDELIILEIVSRIARPFLLLILTLFCFCIGMTQNARYLAAVPRIIYIWILLIPFVMITIMQIILFLHRMGVVFLYYAFGTLMGTLLIAGVHIFFLILALIIFGKKYGVRMGR